MSRWSGLKRTGNEGNGADTAATRRWSDGVRWTICFALAFGFHTAGAAALVRAGTRTQIWWECEADYD